MRHSPKKHARRLIILGAVMAIFLAVATPATAINWGYPDGNLHPNVGAIMYRHPAWGWFPFCSGTLIGERIFLTAGHCSSGSLPEDIYVCFAEDPLGELGGDFFADPPPATYLPVVEVLTHPQYNAFRPRSNNHDVGILILTEAVTDITPAAVADEGFLDEKKKAHELRQGKEERDFIVVGYGGTLDWPPPSVAYYDMRQFAESEYQALTKSWLHMSQNNATGDGGSCYGDSGGPTFWVDADGVETNIIVAITSWGDIPTVATGIAYRADTADTHFLIEFAEAWLVNNP